VRLWRLGSLTLAGHVLVVRLEAELVMRNLPFPRRVESPGSASIRMGPGWCRSYGTFVVPGLASQVRSVLLGTSKCSCFIVRPVSEPAARRPARGCGPDPSAKPGQCDRFPLFFGWIRCRVPASVQKEGAHLVSTSPVNMRRLFTFVLMLGLGSTVACKSLLESIEGKSAAEADTGSDDPDAFDEARRDVIRFVTDVIAQRKASEAEHNLVILGPRVYRRILERDPTFETLGTRLRVAAPGHTGPPRTSRQCSDQQCEEFLMAEGLRETLRPFAAAEFREPTEEELQIITEWTPKTLPEDALPVMAVLDGERMAFYVSDGTVVWFELLSKGAGRPEQEPLEPEHKGGPKVDAKEALHALQCVRLTGVQLGGPDEEFDKNTSSQAMARVMRALDAVLYERKNTAQGPWRIHITFGTEGISLIAAPPKADVDPSVPKTVNQRMLGKALFSEKAVLSLKLDVALRPCAEDDG
jgi:hypothetical protein